MAFKPGNEEWKKAENPGKPSLYKPEYCQMIVDYFTVEPCKVVYVPHYKNGDLVWTDQKKEANTLPTFHGFAKSINLMDTQAMLTWCDNHKEFADSYARAKDLQKYFIAQNALNGVYNAQFAQFMLKNISDWRDQIDVNEHRNISVQLMLPPNELDSRKTLGSKMIEINANEAVYAEESTDSQP